MKYAIYSSKGKELTVLHEVPLIEDLPKGFMAVRTGPRNFSWRSDRPSNLIFVEALDGGNPQDILNRVENSWVNGGEISTDSLNRTKENNDSLKPTDTISSLNTVESPVANIVSEGSMNRQLLANGSKRSSIVIINNQIIKTSNLTVPVGSQSESGDFFPAYNLARLG